VSRPDLPDEIYYQDGLRLPLARRVMLRARRAMLRHFLQAMAPTPATSVLDFGVSDTAGEDGNFLEQSYPWPARITAAGIGSGAAFRRAFPAVGFATLRPGAPLPFGDGSFDIGYSNATLEHLGSDEERSRVLGELLRVARRCYVTVPNRWFPVEHHTGLPLLHYAPALFRRALRGGALSIWADPANLEFLSRRSLRQLGRSSGREFRVAWVGLRCGGLSSNLALWTP
jgi:hypothetical protein